MLAEFVGLGRFGDGFASEITSVRSKIIGCYSGNSSVTVSPSPWPGVGAVLGHAHQ